MIKRDSLYSDIKVNEHPAHRVVLAEVSETFKNMIGDLCEDVNELVLDFPDALVDRLLDVIYCQKFEMDTELFKIIQHMNIKNFKLTTDMIKNMSATDLQNILARHSDIYDVDYDNPQFVDYRFLCCLPHTQFMNIINPIVDTILRFNSAKYSDKIQTIFMASCMRCLMSVYKDYHFQYSLYMYAIYGRLHDNGRLVYLNVNLAHMHKPNCYAVLASSSVAGKTDTLTGLCTEVFKSLGVAVPE